MREVADEAVAQRQAMLLHARGQHLDLHLRHVDAGRTFVAAGLARHAKLERIGHRVRAQRIRPELAGDRETQRVGAAAGDILLVARGAIGRAHHAALELATGAVVVAHLDRTLETAAGARPGRPVQFGLQAVDAIARRIAEQRTVVHFRRIDDLAGIEDVAGIEAPLHFGKVTDDALAEHLRVEFRTHKPVAVLAGM